MTVLDQNEPTIELSFTYGELSDLLVGVIKFKLEFQKLLRNAAPEELDALNERHGKEIQKLNVLITRLSAAKYDLDRSSR